jgi:hypothetical protein
MLFFVTNFHIGCFFFKISFLSVDYKKIAKKNWKKLLKIEEGGGEKKCPCTSNDFTRF